MVSVAISIKRLVDARFMMTVRYYAPPGYVRIAIRLRNVTDVNV